MKQVITRQLILYALILGCCDTDVLAQRCQGHNWMSFLDDTVFLSTLSIPGAHDAATGDGFVLNVGLGRTQELSLDEQWDSGVRAFDLRPALCDTILHIYHGSLRTKTSFSEAIDVILSKLSANPSEFAIVLIRHESESENEVEEKNWSRFMGTYIHSLGNHAVAFHPYLTLGEVRGKILFLTRSPYYGTDKGALVTGWCHSADVTTQAQITSYASSEVATLQMQDYYAPTSKEKQLQKKQGVFLMFKRAQAAEEGVWTMNFLSGYASTWMGTGLFATTSGYKRNAAWLHPLVLDFITTSSSSNGYGIVFMDFVGTDEVPGALFHWASFNTQGKKLLDAIIETNF
ncbi:MAG: hypothetical protein IKU79_02910 [Bacteroidaceae bacterium]|nr:hypothetical protein [Bacteroidaceae bacterium]